MANKLLPLGTTVYLIVESFSDYRFSDEPFHYEIVKGKISEYIRGGYTQYKVPTWSRRGSSLLMYPKSNSKEYFLDWENACKKAEEISDEYVKHWKRILKCGDLLRPWREGEFE